MHAPRKPAFLFFSSDFRVFLVRLEESFGDGLGRPVECCDGRVALEESLPVKQVKDQTLEVAARPWRSRVTGYRTCQWAVGPC